jgi:hypothetical protein
MKLRIVLSEKALKTVLAEIGGLLGHNRTHALL